MAVFLIVLIGLIALVALAASMADSAEGAMQAQAAIQAAQAARAASVTTTLQSLALGVLGVLVVVLLLALLYMIRRDAQRQEDERRWVSGPNAHWARVDQAQRTGRLAPPADPERMLTLAMIARMLGADAPRVQPPAIERPARNEDDEAEVSLWWPR